MLDLGLNHGLVEDLDLVLDPRVESGFVFDHDFDFILWVEVLKIEFNFGLGLGGLILNSS